MKYMNRNQNLRTEIFIDLKDLMMTQMVSLVFFLLFMMYRNKLIVQAHIFSRGGNNKSKNNATTSLCEYVPTSATVWTTCHMTDDDDANMNVAYAFYLKSPSLTFPFSHISKTIIERRKRLNNATNDLQPSTYEQNYRFIARYYRLCSSNESNSIVYVASSYSMSVSFIHSSIQILLSKRHIEKKKLSIFFLLLLLLLLLQSFLFQQRTSTYNGRMTSTSFTEKSFKQIQN